MSKDHRNISIADYTYELPDERIAMFPLEQRDASNLLVYDKGIISKGVFKDLSHHVNGPALMVFNNTRVVQARLLFQKDSGALIEVFCLEPAGEVHDIQLAFQQKNKCSWFCLVGNAKKWKQGTLTMKVGNTTLQGTKGDSVKDGYIVHFTWQGNATFAEMLELAGKTPLPPYIGRKAQESDKERYQTIFARHSGSVAAPTAGLHFTPEVLNDLSSKNIEKTYVTLHVGAGTFKPVSTKTIGDHDMHHEQVIINRSTIEVLLKQLNNDIICVGTTSVRTIESLYWLGAKLINGYTFGSDGFIIEQWEPYENTFKTLPDVPEALEAILVFLNRNNTDTIHGETSLIILPGYTFKLVKTLITNFHQPQSTLLLLVAAFCGPGWKSIYDFALENEFRFLSYGDSCLLKP